METESSAGAVDPSTRNFRFMGNIPAAAPSLTVEVRRRAN
jgi:hypothetical protein